MAGDQPIVKCRYCKGTGVRCLQTLGVCYACKGTKVQPAPKKKLQSLTDATSFLIAVDNAHDAGLDCTTRPDAVNRQEECAYLVGATPIVTDLVKRLPYVVVRVDTQHNASSSMAHFYWRPVFRKDVLIHCLSFLLGLSADDEDLLRHIRCLNKRYEVEGRWDRRTNKRGPQQTRKRWTLWKRRLPKGCHLS